MASFQEEERGGLAGKLKRERFGKPALQKYRNCNLTHNTTPRESFSATGKNLHSKLCPNGSVIAVLERGDKAANNTACSGVSCDGSGANQGGRVGVARSVEQ